MNVVIANLLVCIISLIIGYFFGSIPCGVLLCKIICHKDPRDGGSKNMGGTNVGRQFGKKIGALTMFLDGLKAEIPMLIVWAIIAFSGLNKAFIDSYGIGIYHNGLIAILLAPLGAIIGHCWPIFANFKGGKGASCFIGFIIATNWFVALLCTAVHLCVLKLSKYESLSVIIASFVSIIVVWILAIITICFPDLNTNLFFWGFGITSLWVISSIEYAVIVTISATLVIFRHKQNVKRIINGTENKVKWIA